MGRKCGNIRQLILSDCNLGNIGVAKLKESGLKLIDKLHLFENKINGDGIKILASSDFAHLKYLDISCNKICNRGMSYLAKGNWPKLSTLCVIQCSITVDAFKSIIHAPRRKTKTYNIMIDGVDVTNASSVKTFTKQYYLDIVT
jgi:Ran GTPase-activating protein (RanGAP) involved in mRNA processing and transport